MDFLMFVTGLVRFKNQRGQLVNFVRSMNPNILRSHWSMEHSSSRSISTDVRLLFRLRFLINSSRIIFNFTRKYSLYMKLISGCDDRFYYLKGSRSKACWILFLNTIFIIFNLQKSYRLQLYFKVDFLMGWYWGLWT